MRRLVCVPIIHTEADMGTFKKAIKAEYISGQNWTEYQKIITEFWVKVDKKIDGMNFHYAEVRIYQDSLPICGSKLDIVCDLALQGSKNHQLIVRLLKRGAKLEGTERPDLLLEEYRYLKIIVQGEKTKEKLENARQEYRNRAPFLIAERDEFIAKRIDSTLKEGEVGILFIGAMHEVEKRLPDDIEVMNLFIRI